MKKYFLKYKIINALKLAVALPLLIIYRAGKIIFAKRTILFVTNQKIRSVSFGPLSQVLLISFFVWMGNIFVNSMEYSSILDDKSEEISRLKEENSYFEGKFDELNNKLVKVNEYLSAISGNKHEVKAQESNFKVPDKIQKGNLSKEEKHTLNKVKNAHDTMSDIDLMTQARIKKIEKAIAFTGLNLKKPQVLAAKKASHSKAAKEVAVNNFRQLKNAQGGPLVVADSIFSNSEDEDELARKLEKSRFSSKIDYLVTLENLANLMPMARPMKNYFVSSGFGTRVDPITGGHAVHQGLDFVGPMQERVLSPSTGKVVLAGRFSDYGNAVVIDHGYGITTRYGHLSKVLVRQGQIVKKGDVIALQGSTGRSTGAHLHYEVRYKNTPLNPKKFLEAGDYLFNDAKTAKYVNS